MRSRKSRAFGFEIYRGNGKIQLLDTGLTGIGWADDVLTELESRSGLHGWLRRRRRTALEVHRNALTERSLLRREPGRLLTRQRHYPDTPARNQLIAELRAVYDEQSPLDEHLLFLCDLVDGAELRKDLGLKLSWRRRDRARSAGAVASFPEDLRDTSTLLGAAVPSKADGGAGIAISG